MKRISKKYILALLTCLAGLLALELLVFHTNHLNFPFLKKREALKDFKIELPKNLNFAGELIPVNNLDARSLADQQFVKYSFYSTHTHLIHLRAFRWLPRIEKILKQNGVPVDFKYIPLIESNFVNTRSTKGAAGFWQFIPETAKIKGLEINADIDERLNLEKSTLAACRVLKENYRELHNWTLAAAAFNLGLGKIKQQIANQKSKSYYDLKLNKETRLYIYKLLAAKEIISHPEKYGYQKRYYVRNSLITTEKLCIDSSVTDISSLCIKLKMNPGYFHYLNPWINGNKIGNPLNRPYFLEIIPGNFTNYTLLEKLMQEDSLHLFRE
jgi:membrane-bound lytic murein transglycosylase D